jgi:uncharacterized protein YukE
MRVGDLSSGASKLANALKQLNLKWDAATDTWHDARAKAFHKENVESLLPSVKDTLDALGRLAEVLDRAARDVSDSDGY